MIHAHKFLNFDVLIYNIKYIDNGNYLVRFASKNELNIGDIIVSDIIHHISGVVCTSIIESNKNQNGYFVSIGEFHDEGGFSLHYKYQEMYPGMLDKYAIKA